MAAREAPAEMLPSSTGQIKMHGASLGGYHSAYVADEGGVMKIPHCAFWRRQTTMSVCRTQSPILSSLPPHFCSRA
jgi:hypothetical protein